MTTAHEAGKPYYYVPQPSHWPITGSVALLLMASGAASWMNSIAAGPWLLAAGFALLLFMLFGWFSFSEVMFFGAFFGALFYVRNVSVPDLGSLASKLIWPDFTTGWPTVGPYIKEQFTPMAAMGVPLLNTIILVSSGFTLTVAHHGLKEGKRGQLKLWLALTIVLGATFLGFQAYEYTHAYSELNLKLSTGVYGSTFFMLTGFHGAHVTIGAIMLAVMFVRSLRGHFTPDHHFGFEAAAWYWHFVDVVWLLLFVLVYWL